MGKNSRQSFVVLALTIASGLAAAGCAGPNTVSIASASPSPTPTAACPSAGTEPMPETDCLFYDGDAAMAANEAYRQRRSLTPGMKAQLDAFLDPARAALESLSVPASADNVEYALKSVGLTDDGVQTDDAGNGVRFGAASPNGGCIYGYVALNGHVDISTGGSIMDGGCLEMFGH